MLLKKIGSRVLDLIYPPVCVLCGEYSAGEHLCPRCAASLDSLRSDGSQEAEICRLNPGLELLVTPFLYTGAMRSLLLRLKTTPDHRAVGFLADELAQSLADSGIPEVTVTCMPMSKEKLRRRGYNHAELLAKAVAVRLGCGFDGKLLEHHGGLTDQHTLSREKREEHARASLRPGQGDPRGKTVLLVDDIITTGATLSACALALQQAGAYEITAAAVAATEELPKSLQKSTEKRK